MPMTNVDDLLNTVIEEKLTSIPTTPEKEEPVEREESAPELAPEIPAESHESSEKEEPVAAEQKQEAASSEETDEYGNPVPKARLYTEEELQQRIRDRLSRGRHAEQPQYAPQQQQQNTPDGFQYDPNSTENWDVQLKKFIRGVLAEDQTEQLNRQQHAREAKVQSEFQDRFTNGMSKYQDFTNVVEGKPITDSMMLGIRGLKDPAAFVYAAAKTQAKELERIANLPDPFQQSAEIGKLEERMKKAVASPGGTKPLPKVASDVSSKEPPKRNIDDRIQSHAKRRFGR